MSIVTLPAALRVARIEWGQQRADLEFGDGDAGVSQARVLGPPRWMVSLGAPDHLLEDQAALWRDTIFSLEGRIHQLAVPYLELQAPRGTMRGTLTLASTAAYGDRTLSITGGAGQAGATLLQGDFIGVGSGATRQLISVAADATANGSGVISVTVRQAMRWAQSSGSAVEWNKPTALFRQRNSSSSWSFERRQRSGYGLDLVESWES